MNGKSVVSVGLIEVSADVADPRQYLRDGHSGAELYDFAIFFHEFLLIFFLRKILIAKKVSKNGVSSHFEFHNNYATNL